jgi:hypothetical protein
MILISAALLCVAGGVLAQDQEAPAVNYVSADAVYLNVGRHAGIEIGSRVEVVRDGRTIAILEVVHVSSNSASCRIVEQTEAPRAGDAAVFTAVAVPATPVAATAAAAAVATGTQESRVDNIVSGYVEVQNVLQSDLTGSDISSLQPAIAARILVKNVGGSGGNLRFRDRIRYYHRSQPDGTPLGGSEWYHRLTELSFVVDTPGMTLNWGVGRLIAPHMIGVGIVDGGYVSFAFAKYLRAGVSGGLTPDQIDLSVSSDNVQAGGFVAFDYESARLWRFISSASLMGRYQSGTVNREFVYWQNSFNYYRYFRIFQSVEVDINRDWRRDAAGESATFTNFYIMASGEVTRYASLDLAYDSRKNVRVYETREIPDSLFDDFDHNGYRGGVTVRLPRSVTLRGYGGRRYIDGQRTNQYFTAWARASRLRWRGHSVWLRYAYADARTVTGHRPAVEYRFPATRTTRIDLGAGGYIYQQGTRTTSSYYADLGAYYTRDRYFASGTYRQYFGGNLESILFFLNVGLRL